MPVRPLLAASLLVAAAALPAQAPAVAPVPDTDVFLARIDRSGDSITVGRPANLTRRAGYDNQPSFAPDGATLYFTRRAPNAAAPRADRDVQTDIWSIALMSGSTSPVTVTAESEYSPRPTPDGRALVVVRVELDSTQHLVRVALDGSAPPTPLVPAVRPVGYYAWQGARVAMQVLGAPRTLQVADTLAGRVDTVAADVGRSLQLVPGAGTVSYVQHDTTAWTLVELDLATRTPRVLVPMPARVDDHAWIDGRTVLASDGTRLYRWTRGLREWRLVADWSDAPFRNVTRLAVDARGRQLALVAEPR